MPHTFELKVTLSDGQVWEERVTITTLEPAQLVEHPLLKQAFALLKFQFENHLKEKFGGKAAA